jgi:RNA polymerase sigma factor (sigma-70 family)
MSPDDFDKLLAWLDPDRDRAAIKYEQIRSRLIKMLVCRGCWEAEDLVDEVMDRVAKKVDELARTYEGDPAAYFGGVARNVYNEWVRRQEWLRKQQAPAPDPGPSQETEHKYKFLDECLARLPPEDRELIVEYYQETKQAKIDHRKEIAARRGFEAGALRLRVYRIRKVLRDCVLKRWNKR